MIQEQLICPNMQRRIMRKRNSIFQNLTACLMRLDFFEIHVFLYDSFYKNIINDVEILIFMLSLYKKRFHTGMAGVQYDCYNI